MALITAPVFRIRRAEWSLDRPSQMNVSAYTGRRTIVANPWHGKWRARIELAEIQGEENTRDLIVFFAKLKGPINTFRLPATLAAQNTNSGVTLAVAAAAGATSITTTTPTTFVLAGQRVTLNDQLLVATTNQDGNAFSIEPPLRVAAALGTAVETANPYAHVFLPDSRFSYNIETARRFGFAFDAEEAI